MFLGENNVIEAWRQEEKMSTQGIGDVYIMQKKDELMGAVYSIFESVGDPIRLLKELSDKVDLPENFEGMSVYAFKEWMNSALRGKAVLQLGSSPTHCDFTFNSAVPYLDGTE